MASPTQSELKKQLIAAGLEIFRTQGQRIHLADRVRENLIMDSGVAAVAADPPGVRLVVRVSSTHFPTETPAQLFSRARQLGQRAESLGYQEVDTAVVHVRDPGGSEATLDTLYEVSYEKSVPLEDLIAELRAALLVEKTSAG